MNFADDEDEDSTNIGITRYPCMPSLVALQQMRNRLHLARLGKKLMKWTALATGKELRKTSAEIIQVVEGYPEKISNAYILLARCRYFYPSLNEIVINNIPKAASVIVERSYRSASGIKLLMFTVEETGVVPYPHLGIGQGGEIVKEAKAAWLELLKQMILLLQLRESFITIEGANKGATKKSNVLGKIVIPRISMSITYILSELEEREREEFFRLKRFKEMKAKKNKSDDLHICCCCLGMYESEEDIEVSICDACAKAGGEKSKRTQLNFKLVPCEKAKSEGNQKRIQNLIGHIDDVINMTSQFKSDGLVLPSLDKFIETCSQVKVQIEDYATEPSVCEICSKSLSNTRTQVPTAPFKPTTPSFEKKLAKTPSSVECTPSCGQEKQETGVTPKLSAKSDMDLGYFEQKFKEIVKVTRLQNRDGTISEEKQVITIKTERKTPQSAGNNNINDQVKSCSGSYYGRPGSDQNENSNYRTHEKTEPKVRKCMSATNTNMKSRNGPTCCNDTSCSAMKSTNTMSDSNLSPRSKSDVYVCGRDFTSNPVSKSASIQTCGKTLDINKASCLSADSRGESNTKDTFTEPIWRDEDTSTTGLCGREPTRSIEPDSKSIAEPTICGHNKTGFNSFCIKIVAKEPKNQPKETSEEGQKICEHCLSKLQSCQSPPKRKDETCDLCQKSIPKQNLCTKCEEELEQPDICTVCAQKKPREKSCDCQKSKEERLCPSCKKSVSPSPSTNICSDTSNEHICRPSKKSKSMHSLKKRTSFIAFPKETGSKSNLSDCFPAVHSIKSKSSCTKCSGSKDVKHQPCPSAKAKSKRMSVDPKTSCTSCGTESKEISRKSSVVSTKSAATCCTMKDQSTNTKRSDRYDLRPLRRPLKRHRTTSGGCVCKSETDLRPRGNPDVRRCRSLRECDYNYFQW